MGRFVLVSSAQAAPAVALRALQTGQTRHADAAARIVAEGPEPAAIVDSNLAEVQIRAAARVLRVTDDMVGSLIDAIA